MNPVLTAGKKRTRIKKAFFGITVALMAVLLSACGKTTEKVDGETLKAQMNEYIATATADGTVTELLDFWSSSDYATRTLYYESLPAEHGKLTMGTAVNPPYSCYENGHYGGVSVEFVYRFCQKMGYGLEVIGYSDINSMVMAVSAGKCDIGGTTLTVTEERKKSVDFSDVYSSNPFVLWTRADEASEYTSLEDFSGKSIGVLAGSCVPDIIDRFIPDNRQYEYNSVTDILYALSGGKIDAGTTNKTLAAEVTAAFPDAVQVVEIPYDNNYGLIYPKSGEQNSVSTVLYRTFLQNDRWQIFLNGILTTLELSVLSIVFGTLLGFAVYYLVLRRPKKVPEAILNVILWIIRCTPAVLFLLIFYYVVFGNTQLGGTFVCAVAFTVIFAAAFLGCFTSAMNTVDPGQEEVSLALGYSSRKSFFRILLPQALTNLWPGYQNAIINHIKATSIVGYVAVIDVTKAGDMIRSSTYDALVPLISAAVFYFAVIWLITFLVRLIRVGTEPSEQRRKRRLKGVQEHD